MSLAFLYVLIVGGTVLGAFASYNFKGASPLFTGVNMGSVSALAHDKRFILGVVLYLIAAANNIFILRYMDYSIILPMASLTYIWTMIIAYKYGKLSVLQPMLCLAYVFAIFIAVFILNETMTPFRLAGIIVIIVGVAFLVDVITGNVKNNIFMRRFARIKNKILKRRNPDAELLRVRDQNDTEYRGEYFDCVHVYHARKRRYDPLAAEKKDSKTAKILIWVFVGICAAMWLLLFVQYCGWLGFLEGGGGGEIF